ncbi:hypothetical protein P4S73_05435 [Paraglaciecola sp. Hal342]
MNSPLTNHVFTQTDYSYLDALNAPELDETTALFEQLSGTQNTQTDTQYTQTDGQDERVDALNEQANEDSDTALAQRTITEPTWVKMANPAILTLCVCTRQSVAFRALRSPYCRDTTKPYSSCYRRCGMAESPKPVSAAQSELRINKA